MTALRPILQPVLQPVLRSVFDPPMRRGGRTSLTDQVIERFGPALAGMYDFTSLEGLYQDASGTTPVTAYDQPIGLALDKGGSGHHLTQSTTPARPRFTAQGALHDGVDDFLMAANAEDWTFLHDGTGGFMGASSIYLGEPGQTFGYYGTQTSGGSSIGISQGQQNVNLARSTARLFGDGEGLSLGPSPTGSMPSGVVASEMLQHANSHVVRWLNGIEFDDTPYDGFVPASGDPARPLSTHVAPPNQPLIRRRMIAINRTLTEAERDLVNGWLMEGA